MRSGAKAARGVAAAVAFATVLASAACTNDRPEATPPDRAAHPAVITEQARTVVEAVEASLIAGAPTGDTAALGARVTGPYRNVLLATAAAATLQKKKAAVPPRLTNARLLVPAVSAWPRFFVAAGTAAGRPTPVLRVFTSPSAREPYGLWAEMVLLPGASVPAVAPPSAGAEVLDYDTPGLVATPLQVAERYADVLVKGETSSFRGLFAADEFSRQVYKTLADDRKALRKTAKVTSEHVVEPGSVFALRTTDGGALVFAALRHTYGATVQSGEDPIRVNDPTVVALAKKNQFAKEFVKTSVEVMAFRVPPVGQGKVSVVAGEKGVYAVRGS